MSKTIEAGRYTVRPLRSVPTETKEGKPQICITIRHLEGEHAGREDQWYGGLGTDSAAENTAKTLRDLGWTGDDITQVTFAGDAVASAVYEEDEYDGEKRIRLRYLNAAGFTPRAIDASRLSEAQERLRAALARVDAKRGTRTEAAVPEAARPVIAKLGAVGSTQAAARFWNENTMGLDEATKKAVWGAVVARFDGSAVKAELERLRAPKAQAQTVDAMPMPANF
jgi:hypothetical protein